MPIPETNTSYRSYRPTTQGTLRTIPQKNSSPIGTGVIPAVSVPKKSDFVSPRHESTPIRTNTRAVASESTRTYQPKNRVITKRVFSRTSANPTEQNAGHGAKSTLKGGYILFFLVLGIVVAKDFLDLIIVIFTAVGAGLTATAVGSVVGIPLVFISEVISKLSSLFLSMIIMTYFWFIGGKFALRLVAISIGAIIDAIPIVNLLPMATISFVIAFVLGRIITKVESATIGKFIPAAIAKRI